MTIVHKSLNQLVYERLRNEILEGKLVPGTRIKQEELTKRLGASRTPIREALQRLETEGLVQFIRRGSAIVSAISRKRVGEIFELRALLEGYAAERAADRLTPKTLRKLHRLIEEMNTYHSRQEIGRLLTKNDEFHRAICAQADNETLLEMLEQIWRDIRRLRFNYLLTPAGHETSTLEHKALVDALESQDRKRIRGIVKQHARRTMQGILDTLEPQRETDDMAQTDRVARMSDRRAAAR